VWNSVCAEFDFLQNSTIATSGVALEALLWSLFVLCFSRRANSRVRANYLDRTSVLLALLQASSTSATRTDSTTSITNTSSTTSTTSNTSYQQYYCHKRQTVAGSCRAHTAHTKQTNPDDSFTKKHRPTSAQRQFNEDWVGGISISGRSRRCTCFG
jgi:hypothetical protein